jgi:hypothetical protein
MMREPGARPRAGLAAGREAEAERKAAMWA